MKKKKQMINDQHHLYYHIFYKLLKEWAWNLQLTTKRATSVALWTAMLFGVISVRSKMATLFD